MSQMKPRAVSYTHLDVYKRQVVGGFIDRGVVDEELKLGLAVADNLYMIGVLLLNSAGLHTAEGLSLIHI